MFLGSVGWYPWSEFQNLSFLSIKEEALSLSVFFYCSNLCFSLLLSQFQPIFMLFVTIFTVLCLCFKAMFLVGIIFTHTEHVLLHFTNLLILLTYMTMFLIHLHAGYLIPQSLEEQAPLQSNTLTLSMDFPTSFGDGVEKMMTSTTGTYICATTVLLISMSPAYFSVTDLFCNMKMMWSSEIQIFRRR